METQTLHVRDCLQAGTHPKDLDLAPLEVKSASGKEKGQSSVSLIMSTSPRVFALKFFE